MLVVSINLRSCGKLVEEKQKHLYQLPKGANDKPKAIVAKINSRLIGRNIGNLELSYQLIGDEKYNISALNGEVIITKNVVIALQAAIHEKKLNINATSLMYYRLDGILTMSRSADKELFGFTAYNEAYRQILEEAGITPLPIIGND